MNRAEQLKKALISSFNCNLPSNTEFIIVDNASSDKTSDVVKELFSKYNFPHKYIKENENRGVGGGRNIGFSNAEGEFVYFLDDDAIISSESYLDFFLKPIELFESNCLIASITTRIYDEILKNDREVRISLKTKINQCPDILIFLGGSHFLRKSYYDNPLYLNFKYGMEELLPSIRAIDMGYRNCYIHDISVIHQPKIDKWSKGSNERRNIATEYCINMLITRILIYPYYMHPVLWISFVIRSLIHIGCDFKLFKLVFSRLKSIDRKKTRKKVKFKTLVHILKNYSFSGLV